MMHPKLVALLDIDDEASSTNSIGPSSLLEVHQLIYTV